jgi:hypothetical protein
VRAITDHLAARLLEQLAAEFDRCWPWLEAAVQHGGSHHTRESVWQGVIDGRFQFWPGVRSAAITHIDVFPTGNVFRVWLVGGELDVVLAHEPDLAAWAEAKGCVSIELSGRHGWVKVLAPYGYSPGGITMTRRLDHGSPERAAELRSGADERPDAGG